MEANQTALSTGCALTLSPTPRPRDHFSAAPGRQRFGRRAGRQQAAVRSWCGGALLLEERWPTKIGRTLEEAEQVAGSVPENR